MWFVNNLILNLEGLAYGRSRRPRLRAGPSSFPGEASCSG
ncbi:hypothetical protein MICRO8M_90061 [Microbacterium sp. 8M]|nr:hypothetical protein MICRO8M_90061 [Microbacterium sp. 8M]